MSTDAVFQSIYGSVQDWQVWLAERGRKPKTRKSYLGTIRRLQHWLANPPAHTGLPPVTLLEATEEHLRAWRSAQTVSGDSVLTYAAAVRSFYSWAMRRGKVSADPTLDLPLPRRRRRLPRPISEEDLELAVDTADERVRICLVLAAQQGMRADEIAKLERDWILETYDPPMMMITGKNDVQRLVPLAPSTWTELVAYGLPRRGYVVRREDGQIGPNTEKRISQICNDHLRECGIDATLHQLRHRFATIAYRVDRDLRQVQELLGHANSATTAIYTAYYQPDAVRTIHAVQIRGGRLRAVRDRHDRKAGGDH